MSMLRLITILVNVLLLFGMAVAIMSQAGDSKLAWILLPWFAWPYILAFPAWWHGKKLVSQIMTLIFIVVCAVIQGLAYGKAFIWHLDSQSAYGWFISPLYCLPMVVFLIPHYLERRHARTDKLNSSTRST